MSDKKFDGYVCPLGVGTEPQTVFLDDPSFLSKHEAAPRELLLFSFLKNRMLDTIITTLPDQGLLTPQDYINTYAQRAVDAINLTPYETVSLVGNYAFTMFQAPFYKDINRFRYAPDPRLVTTKNVAFGKFGESAAKEVRDKIMREIGSEMKRLGLESFPAIWPLEDRPLTS